MHEATAVVAARDGAALVTAGAIAAQADLTRKVFYMVAANASEALADAAAAALAFGVRQIARAFDAQPSRPQAIRAATVAALALMDADPHWALLCVRDAHAQPIAATLPRADLLRPLIDRLRDDATDDAPAWAAIDAVEGAARHALTDRASATTATAASLGELGTELAPLVLDLLGERRRGRGRLLPPERSPAARVDTAFDALPGSATDLEALLAAGDGVALWRAFVRLNETGHARDLDGTERALLTTTLAGLADASHFGLPVAAIAAGTAPERWTPVELRRASDPDGAPIGLFVEPLGELERAAMAILADRPGITEHELERALGTSRARTRQILGRLERGLVRRAPVS